MNAQAPGRGAELVAGGSLIGIGPQWLARVWSGGMHRVLDRLDAGLARGSIEAMLPDGTKRLLGGRAPGFDAVLIVRDWRGLLRLATGGSVGGYQGWEAGEWDSPDPVTLFAIFMDNAATLGEAGRAHGPWRLAARFGHWLHRNTKAGSQRNIHAHYDLGNDFYAGWLDPTMSYSSACFDGVPGDLESAQHRKIEHMVQRLAGAQTVLEIGCGWGSLARRFADGGAQVTAISLSDEQLAWARERHVGTGHAIDFRKQDYRDVVGQFDAVASAEMVEAVGQEFWPDFFDAIARNLRPGGRAAIQYISIRDDLFEGYAKSADFIQTYIFPGGMLVHEPRFRRLAEERGLRWQDRKSFGPDYAETLLMWRQSFDCAVEEGRLPAGFDERFVRLWRFYLMYCEGGFRGGGIDVAQVTLVKQPE
jgi:cyclopropane-fatty-acyl-phospholipid synthase